MKPIPFKWPFSITHEGEKLFMLTSLHLDVSAIKRQFCAATNQQLGVDAVNRIYGD